MKKKNILINTDRSTDQVKYRVDVHRQAESSQNN